MFHFKDQLLCHLKGLFTDSKAWRRWHLKAAVSLCTFLFEEDEGTGCRGGGSRACLNLKRQQEIRGGQMETGRRKERRRIAKEGAREEKGNINRMTASGARDGRLRVPGRSEESQPCENVHVRASRVAIAKHLFGVILPRCTSALST